MSMSFIDFCFVFSIIWLIIFIILLFIMDGDLSLMINAKFGKKIGKFCHILKCFSAIRIIS